MNTLTIKNTWKNLTLVAAGALMATMIAVPLAGSASADDDEVPYLAPEGNVTYAIKASDGFTSRFELVENDGQLMLVLVDATSTFVAPEDDD